MTGLGSTLSWVRLEGAESCLAAPALAEAVETRLGRAVFVAPALAQLAVEGRAERVEGAWRATLRVADRDGAVLGERVVESRAADCAELGEVVTVTLALMIDPELPPPPPRWGFELGSSAGVGLGLLPGVGLGGRVRLGVDPPGFVPVSFEGELLPYGVVDGVGFTRMTGGLALCPLSWAPGRFGLDGCLGIDAGVLFVVAGEADATERVLVEAQLLARPRLRVVGPLWLESELRLYLPLRAVAFAAEGEPLFAPSPVAGMLDLGLGLRL